MQPDNDSPTRKLWMASKNWLSVERLLHAHTRVIQEVEGSVMGVLRDPLEYLDHHRSFEHRTLPFSLQWNLSVLERCSNLVQDDLLKPTADLLDMVRPRGIFAFFSRGCTDLTCLSSLDVQICRHPRRPFVAEPQRKPVKTQLDYFHLLATDISLGIFRHERRLVFT